MEKRTCELDECDSPRHGLEWCKRHYNRWRRTGNPRGRQAEREAQQEAAQHITTDDGTVIKRCRVCKERRPLDQFGPDGRTFDGLSSRCRECRNVYMRENARNRTESDPAFREKRAAYWQTHREGQTDQWARKRNRAYKLKAYYGMTVEQYDELLATQDGRCAICRQTQDEADTRKRNLSVDHCHDSGAIRGLLCESCNIGLGKFRDDPELLEAALNYLTRAAG
jgi:hypothetical protein